MRVKDYTTVEVNGVTIIVNMSSVDVSAEQNVVDALDKLSRHIDAVEEKGRYAGSDE